MQYWGADGTTSRITNGTARLTDQWRTGDARQDQPGRCYTFDGAADEIALAANTVGRVDQTMAAWIKTSSSATDYILSTRDGTVGALSLLLASSSLRAAIGTTLLDAPTGGSAATDGSWHHVAIAYHASDDAISYWIDGTLLEKQDVAGSPTWTTGADVYIGNREAGSFVFT